VEGKHLEYIANAEIRSYIMWHVDSWLDNDREISSYTIAIAKSVLSTIYYLVTLLARYMFRPLGVFCLVKTVAICVKILYRVWTRYFLIKINWP
jgi:hypothetical protein